MFGTFVARTQQFETLIHLRSFFLLKFVWIVFFFSVWVLWVFVCLFCAHALNNDLHCTNKFQMNDSVCGIFANISSYSMRMYLYCYLCLFICLFVIALLMIGAYRLSSNQRAKLLCYTIHAYIYNELTKGLHAKAFGVLFFAVVAFLSIWVRIIVVLKII